MFRANIYGPSDSGMVIL